VKICLFIHHAKRSISDGRLVPNAMALYGDQGRIGFIDLERGSCDLSRNLDGRPRVQASATNQVIDHIKARTGYAMSRDP
jgi:hypothetical protein